MLELQKIGGPLGAAVHTISITLNTRTPAAQKVVAVPRSLGLRPLAPLVIIWELAFFCSQLRCPLLVLLRLAQDAGPSRACWCKPRLAEPLQLGSPQEKHKAGHEVGGDQARTEKKFICTPLSGSSVKIAFVLRASAI